MGAQLATAQLEPSTVLFIHFGLRIPIPNFGTGGREAIIDARLRSGIRCPVKVAPEK